MKRISFLCDYEQIIRSESLFIDRTELIAQICAHSRQVCLISAPHHSGKSIYASMLRSFFEQQFDPEKPQLNPRPFFRHQKIYGESELCLQHMGRHPVMYLDFKNCNDSYFYAQLAHLRQLIGDELQRFSYLGRSEKLSEAEKDLLQSYIHNSCSDEVFSNCLRDWSEWAYRVTGRKPVLIVDNYDTPLYTAFWRGFSPKTFEILHGLFSRVLLGNQNLERAVLFGRFCFIDNGFPMGIEGCAYFSPGTPHFEPFFGTTYQEAYDLFCSLHLEARFEEAKIWYGGFGCGSCKFFGTGSLLHLIQALLDRDPQPFKSYLTVDDDAPLFQALLPPRVPELFALQTIIYGGNFEHRIKNEHAIMTAQSDWKTNLDFLYHSGFLYAKALKTDDGRPLTYVRAANLEAITFLNQIMTQWFLKGQLYPDMGIELPEESTDMNEQTLIDQDEKTFEFDEL